MKLIICVFVMITLFLVASCKKEEAKPIGLSGNWILVQKSIRKSLASKPVIQNIPSQPIQTISFLNDNKFKNTISQDTLFAKANYFLTNTIGDYVGPSFALFENPDFTQKSVVSSQLYEVNQDSLITNTSSGQQAIEYKFYRLQ